MKFLLDTHLLLWVAQGSEKLSPVATQLINAPENELFFSAASLWEIVIKNSLNRTDFSVDSRVLRRSLVDNGYIELPVRGDHAVMVENLPRIHKDPFDRILVAQILVEGMTLLTSDTRLTTYSGSIRHV